MTGLIFLVKPLRGIRVHLFIYLFQAGNPNPTFDILVLTTPLNSCSLSFLLSLSLLPLGQRLFLTQLFVASDTPGPRSCLGPLDVAQMQKMQRDTVYTHALRND